MSRAESMHTTPRIEDETDIHPLDDLVEYARCYVQEKPEMAALICFGVGFVLGWKLKFW